MAAAAEDIRKHVRVYWLVFFALAILTIVTVAAARLDLAIGLAVTVAMIIAVAKGSLVASVFMHLLFDKNKVIGALLLLCLFFFAVLMLLPLLTLMIPLFKIAPPLYRWRIRSRIYKWYELLRAIEADLKPGTSRDALLHHIDAVADIEQELDDLSSVPLSHMEEFYNLRLHVELVRGRVKRLLDEGSALQG